jgi:tRNA (guanine-N7-)-methyltransferase
MGRRTLPKVDATLDLSRHLKMVDELPVPWSAEALFQRAAPLEVEIGSGKGLFMQSASQAVPEHNFLGIELARKYARYSASRLAKRAITNGVMISGDALHVIREILPPGTAVAVHVYFPDPWWKKRHHKRRVMTEQSVKDIERLLSPGGALHFWTDVEEYFHGTLELLAAHTRLQGPLPVEEQAPAHELDYRTHFERRMRLHGAPVYRSEYRKLLG